ncbi:hypothetical protein H0H93_004497 [Arthromyces matolae]|nr:hypothetical protein H0H93_004497 [Arthromyces matolae]
MFKTALAQLCRPSLRLYSTLSHSQVAALNTWISTPREQELTDAFHVERLSDLYITLPTRDGSRQPYKPPKETSPLGYAHHVAFFHARTPEAELREDGTDADFSPPEPFTRRMWAGGRMVWDPELPLMIGQRATATWGIDSCKKAGFDDPNKTPMVFVNQRIDITMKGNNRPSLTEERSHVYFAVDSSPAKRERRTGERYCDMQHHDKPHPLSPVKDIPAKSDFSFTYKPSLATLFRYSALMFNAHSVHLDLGYTKKEGHAGKPKVYRFHGQYLTTTTERLVHGPLTATMLLETAIFHHPGIQLTSFEYRAHNPIVVNRECTIHGVWTSNTSMKLWAVDEDGVVGMTGMIQLL